MMIDMTNPSLLASPSRMCLFPGAAGHVETWIRGRTSVETVDLIVDRPLK